MGRRSNLMKIYTSYFSNYRNFPEGSKTICIARIPPKGFRGASCEKLAPSNDLLFNYKCGLVNEGMYEGLFKEYLRTLDKEEILRELEKMGNGKNVVLCCYEKKGSFCHRKFVGDWLGGEEL